MEIRNEAEYLGSDPWPDAGTRIDNDKMVGLRKQTEPRTISVTLGCFKIACRLSGRDWLILFPLNDHDWKAQREHGHRRGLGECIVRTIHLWQLFITGGSSHLQIGQSGQWNRTGQWKWISRIELTLRRKPVSPGCPEGEMATSRVTSHDNSSQIERKICCQLAKMVDRPCDIQIGPRPAASIVTETTILDIPGCNTGSSQIRAQMAHIFKGVQRAPAAAMNHDDDRKRPRTIRQSQITELCGA